MRQSFPLALLLLLILIFILYNDNNTVNNNNVGRHLQIYFNRRDGALRRIDRNVRAIDNGQQVNDPMAQMVIDAGDGENTSHLDFARLLGDSEPEGDLVPPATLRQRLEEMTLPVWNGMDEDDQIQFLVQYVTLGYNADFDLFCVSFHGGQALRYFALVSGLSDRFYANGSLKQSAASVMLTLFRGHFGARITVQAESDSEEIERGLDGSGRFSLGRVAIISVYHACLETAQAARDFRPQGIQEYHRNRMIERAVARDVAEAELLSSSGSESEDSDDEVVVVNESEDELVEDSEDEVAGDSEEEVVKDSDDEVVEESDEDESKDEASFNSEDESSNDDTDDDEDPSSGRNVRRRSDPNGWP
eukprot:scaffold1528_cov83-Skeletonema_dohrnii-CCMP3373.AAC.4